MSSALKTGSRAMASRDRGQLGTLAGVMKEESASRAIELVSRWIGEAITAGRDLTRQLRPPALYEDAWFRRFMGSPPG